MKRRGVAFFLFIFVLYADASEKIPEFKAQDTNGKRITSRDLDKNTTVILFFDPLNLIHRTTLQYAQVLLHRYSGNGLDIIGISTGDASSTKYAGHISSVEYPLIPDKMGTMFGLLNIGSCCGGPAAGR